jgi:hypothetical protein
VPFVVVDQQLAGDAAAPHGGHQLLGLTQRDAWVLGAVDEEEGCADRVGPAQRGGGGEEFAVGGEGAVLPLAVGPPVVGRSLEEGDEVTEPFPVAGGWQVGPDTPTADR